MLHTKTLYNALRLNPEPGIDCPSWALEDLRSIPLDALFQRAGALGICLNRETFLRFAESSETPEELADLFLEDGADLSLYDPLYLILFEIWRRLLPEKRSLSLFCDEIDHLISLYDAGDLESDEPIQDMLANLQEILEKNVDAGGSPKEVFDSIAERCAHDLEMFLYDYIADLIDGESELYALELIDGFSLYLQNSLWFELLRALGISKEDPIVSKQILRDLLEQRPPLEVLFGIIDHLISSDADSLFVEASSQALCLVREEEDFQDLLSMFEEAFSIRDWKLQETQMSKMLKNREGKEGLLAKKDPDLLALQNLIKGLKRAGSGDNPTK